MTPIIKAASVTVLFFAVVIGWMGVLMLANWMFGFIGIAVASVAAIGGLLFNYIYQEARRYEDRHK